MGKTTRCGRTESSWDRGSANRHDSSQGNADIEVITNAYAHIDNALNSKSFQRKIKLSQPPNFVEERFRAAVGPINTNRGFRPEFAIGDLTLEFALTIEREPSVPKTTSNVQTEYEKSDVQSTFQVI